MCELAGKVPKRSGQDDSADQGKAENDGNGAPEGGDALLKKLPTIRGLTYSGAHESSPRLVPN
jgi:hypothetical protein